MYSTIHVSFLSAPADVLVSFMIHLYSSERLFNANSTARYFIPITRYESRRLWVAGQCDESDHVHGGSFLPSPTPKQLIALSTSCSCDLEAITCHTTPVFADEVLAGFLWIAGGREKHAFVASGFLVLADTARLENNDQCMFAERCARMSRFDVP